MNKEALEKDVNAGAAPFKECLDLANKKPTRVVTIDCSNEEEGLMAISYLAGVYNHKDNIYENMYGEYGADADAEVPDAVRENAEARQCNASVYCLDYNYRSNEKIISWVNSVFNNRTVTLKEAYRAMVAQKKTAFSEGEKALEGVYYYKNPEGENVKYGEDAKQLTEMILKLVGNSWKLTDYDKEGKPYTRRMKYSDFLILCNTKKNMDLYLHAMIKSGIHVQINGEVSLGNHYAISSFVRLFDYLTHPIAICSSYPGKAGFDCDGFYQSRMYVYRLFTYANT